MRPGSGLMRVSPWASWAEWKSVYGQLSSPAAAERRRGVARVQTWRSRGRLPVAVDLTACFVEIMLNDPACNSDTEAPRSEYELQLMYSMAVVRLVNGIVDAARRGAVAGSIAALAQELEWPQWFVDLRHEATHQALPSLALLRLAAKEALHLLFERFWRAQLALVEQRGAGARSDGLGRTEVRAVLPPRDRRFLDQRLRRLVRTARKRSRDADEAAAAADDDADVAGVLGLLASELAGLAPDEARLLSCVFTGVLTSQPGGDKQQARALHSLCAHCSDNFPLRLARRLLERALGLRSGSAAQPVPDDTPGLRNACDTGPDRQHRSCSQSPSRAGDDGDGDEDDVVEQRDAQRMLSWLRAMLDPDLDEAETKPFTDAVSGLLPPLQGAALRRIAEATAARSTREARALTARTAQVWRALRETRVAGARGLAAPAAVGTDIVAAAARDAQAKTPAARGPPSLADVEELLRARKRRREGEAQDGRVSREPWTAVGSIMDPESLGISCRQEAPDAPGADAMHHWVGCDNAPPCQQQPTDATQEAQAESAAALEEVRSAPEGDGVDPDLTDLAGLEASSVEAASGPQEALIEETTAADYRRRAAALMGALGL